MDWDRVRNEAKEVRGRLQQKWSRLTDEDFLLLDGTKEGFISRLQERTGLTAAEASLQFDALVENLDLDRTHHGVIHLNAS